MSDKEIKDAENAALEGDTELAHSIYARLAYRARRFGDKVKAEFYNLRAGIYAPDNKDDHASGYIAVIEGDDDE